MLRSSLSTAHKVSVIIVVPFTHFPLSYHLHSPSCITPPLYGKGKCKGHPTTGHEGPEGEQKYGSTLSLTSALDGGGWSTPRPGRFTSGKDPVPIAQEPAWAPGPVCTGAENLAPTGIRSPDRPARSESPY
jgi:hypothetical protein